MKPWYAFNNSAGADNKAAELSIFDEIGPWGVTAKDFNRDLKAVEAKTINLQINSIGGDVFAGLGIYNALKASGKTINVKVMGLAASIASIIAMAGDEIEMPENTFMMVHNPWSFAMGNADELRDTADVLDKIGDSLTQIYVKRTGKTEDEVKALLKAETYMSAADAKKNGFADKVTPEIKASAKFDIDDLPQNVKAIFLAATKPPAPAPAPAPTPSPAPAPQATKSFADSVKELCVAAGLDEFSAVFALDAKLADDLPAATAAIEEAKEIKALCVMAKLPDEAKTFINARTSKIDARAKLVELLAKADEATHSSNVPKPGNTPAPAPAPAAQLTVAGVWAKRNEAIK